MEDQILEQMPQLHTRRPSDCENRWEQSQFNKTYLRRLKDGDSETQRHFARYFGRLLTIKLFRRLRSPELREEVRQETLLRALMIVHRDGVRNPEALGSLVNSICNHVLYEVLRAEGREFPVTEIVAEPADKQAGPELTLLSRERRSQVRRILGQLSSKDRTLLEHVFLDELDRDEVCMTFRVDRAYLRVLLHRAKERFRACSRQMRQI